MPTPMPMPTPPRALADTPAGRRLVAELTRGAATAQAAVPVSSPCRNVCRMDAASGYCEGCLRTIDEIAAWSQAGDAARRRIWRELPGRVARLPGVAPASAPASVSVSDAACAPALAPAPAPASAAPIVHAEPDANGAASGNTP